MQVPFKSPSEWTPITPNSLSPHLFYPAYPQTHLHCTALHSHQSLRPPPASAPRLHATRSKPELPPASYTHGRQRAVHGHGGGRAARHRIAAAQLPVLDGDTFEFSRCAYQHNFRSLDSCVREQYGILCTVRDYSLWVPHGERHGSKRPNDRRGRGLCVRLAACRNAHAFPVRALHRCQGWMVPLPSVQKETHF